MNVAIGILYFMIAVLAAKVALRLLVSEGESRETEHYIWCAVVGLIWPASLPISILALGLRAVDRRTS